MSGAAISSSVSSDPYSTSLDASQLDTEAYSYFSPASVFDADNFGADFTSDSATSPVSPISPSLSATSLGFPTAGGWAAWDSAEPFPEHDGLLGCQTFASCPPSNPTLSPAINPIALSRPPYLSQSPQALLASCQPQQQQAPVPSSSPSTASPTSPTTDIATTKRRPSRMPKRKSTSAHTSDDEPAPSKRSPSRRASRKTADAAAAATNPAAGPRKKAHNMVEKRYRTNLNDKIIQLRDAVPSLREMAARARLYERAGAGGASSELAGFEDLSEGEGGGLLADAHGGARNFDLDGCSGSGGAAKLNKATILAKATEYILLLEQRNRGLETENNALRGRMEGLEMWVMQAANGGAEPVVGGWN
ncbi:f164f39c-9a91-4988-8b16-7ad1262c02d6 [Thermothielavioides terrestris]|uniref:F164f39c-9a91-4988-8b16-7ad1262c02d6 n=1 Tax=Thermothielavioides terrestris TaxID=2587410 RepID=A0A3S4D1G5_9PEZI|nr:f164f39c-9a91-4988-8b16-7ad1262c02d6 [Thermothielavioides terrestris]